jgi:DNA repair exonuclease SbcCD ATPase subunit
MENRFVTVEIDRDSDDNIIEKRKLISMKWLSNKINQLLFPGIQRYVENTVSPLRSKITELEKSNKELEKSNKEYAQEIEYLKNKVNNLESLSNKVESLSNKVESLMSVHNSKQTQLDTKYKDAIKSFTDLYSSFTQVVSKFGKAGKLQTLENLVKYLYNPSLYNKSDVQLEFNDNESQKVFDKIYDFNQSSKPSLISYLDSIGKKWEDCITYPKTKKFSHQTMEPLNGLDIDEGETIYVVFVGFRFPNSNAESHLPCVIKCN